MGNAYGMVQNMKAAEYKKPTKTIPDGVWESTRPYETTDKNPQFTKTTDLQGNGYPVTEYKNSYHNAGQMNNKPS